MITSNKRGLQWEILVSFILGLIVVSIVFFWLFQEYFTEEGLSLEACRQSILVRNNIPDISIKGFTIETFKDKFPLKCETQVININNETENIPGIIMDAMAECWYLFGKGDFQIYPSRIVPRPDSYCMGCARIHFKSDLKGSFSVQGALEQIRMPNGQTYKEYLTDNGKNPIIKDNRYANDLDVSYNGNWFYQEINVKLPRKIDFSKGDLFIVPVQFIIKDGEFNTHLLYFQDMMGHNFKKLGSPIVKYAGIEDEQKICNNWEGIPG